MTVQARQNLDTKKFIIQALAGSLTKTLETLIQNASRTIPLLQNTLMAKIAASQKWTPLINVANTAGIQALTNTGALGAFTGATASGLGAATYDIDYKDDANPNAPLTVVVAGGEDWDAIAALIQASIRASTSALETVAVVAGQILFTSATTGSASACLVAPGTTGSGGGDILAAITALGADYTATLATPVDGVDTLDGTAIPAGIYRGDDIAAATIVAGDVTDLSILVLNAKFDEDMLTIENSLTLETVITIGTYDLRTVRDHLAEIGLIPIVTNESSAYENT